MLIKDGTRKGRMKKDSLYVVLKVHKTKYSSLAQSVEHSAVNRSVVGSSPTGGAHKTRKLKVYGFYTFQKRLVSKMFLLYEPYSF